MYEAHPTVNAGNRICHPITQAHCRRERNRGSKCMIKSPAECLPVWRLSETLFQSSPEVPSDRRRYAHPEPLACASDERSGATPASENESHIIGLDMLFNLGKSGPYQGMSETTHFRD